VTTLDAESNSALSRVLSKADNLGATVFSVALPTGDPSKLADPTPTQVALYDVARRRLQLISDRTGGRLDPINRLEEMGRIYAEVAASVRALYTIEYQSSDDRRDGKWRKISIEVDNPQLVVKTKPGYFAK
jgi:VWFA-related protein